VAKVEIVLRYKALSLPVRKGAEIMPVGDIMQLFLLCFFELKAEMTYLVPLLVY